MSKSKPFFILILSLSSLLGGCATTSWKGTPAQFNQADYDTIERVAVLNPRIKFGEGKLKWTLAERDTSPMCVGYYERENRERLDARALVEPTVDAFAKNLKASLGWTMLNVEAPLYNDAYLRLHERYHASQSWSYRMRHHRTEDDDEYALGQLYWPQAHLTGGVCFSKAPTMKTNTWAASGLLELETRREVLEALGVDALYQVKVDAMSLSQNLGPGQGADHRVLVVVEADLLHGSQEASIWRGRITYEQPTEGHIWHEEWLPHIEAALQKLLDEQVASANSSYEDSVTRTDLIEVAE